MTIALGQAIDLVLVNEDKITGGANGIGHIKMPNLFGFPINTDGRYYYILLIMVILGYIIRQIVGHRMAVFRATS